MKLDKNSNGYTFGFALVMVLLVGTILSLTSMGLKPLQDRNKADKKRIDILSAVNVEATRKNAGDLYNQHVIDSYVINSEGEKISDGPDAFSVDVQGQYRDQRMKESEKSYPLFVCEKEGKKYYVIPMAGKGLWGPIWGYVSLQEDYHTIFGASFDHKGETPGLGAEINQKWFQAPFAGKEIVDESGSFRAIVLAKGGAAPDSKYEVDAITGGTITSKGVEEMLDRTLKIYYNHFSKEAQDTGSAAISQSSNQ